MPGGLGTLSFMMPLVPYAALPGCKVPPCHDPLPPAPAREFPLHILNVRRDLTGWGEWMLGSMNRMGGT